MDPQYPYLIRSLLKNYTENWNGSKLEGDIEKKLALNATEIIPEIQFDRLRLIGMCFVLGIVIAVTVVGNLFVVIAVLTEKSLQKPQNNLIVSLAVADLAVGVAVLPFALIYEVVDGRWTFGAILCDIWISADIGACSASILNMVAIAVDRYWSVTDIQYSKQRRSRTILIMIPIVWLTSLLISVLPMFGWQDKDFYTRIETLQICLISQELGFQVVSTIVTFYAPMVTILSLHVAIFRAARKRIRKRRCAITESNEKNPLVLAGLTYLATARTLASSPSRSRLPRFRRKKPPPLVLANRAQTVSTSEELLDTCTTSATKVSVSASTKIRFFRRPAKSMVFLRQRTLSENSDAGSCQSLRSDADPDSTCSSAAATPTVQLQKKQKLKASLQVKRERKAFHTLAIITGTFILCWLPFFILALVRPFCGCEVNNTLQTVVTWLGWINSLLNPVIYTIFAPDFRTAFRRILLQIVPTGFRTGFKNISVFATSNGTINAAREVRV